MKLEEFRDTREPAKEENTQCVEVDQYHVTLDALTDYISAYDKYLECKSHLEYKKASLIIHTDWSNALPNHNRPTVNDKESYVTETVYVLQGKVNEAYLRKRDYEERYKIELLELEAECRQ